MSDTIGIETRSRSRSKTPGLLATENGDSKGAKKIPTVSLIEEEEVIEVSSQPSQRPKRQRRSAKNQSDTSGGDVTAESIVSNNKQSKISTSTSTTTTTSSTTVVTTKQTINGSEEKSSEETTSKLTTLSMSNNDAPEITESQNIFNNIFNAIKTSTPILSTKRTKRITQDVNTLDIDYNAHPAYKEYKEAGEYWNKYPKTDYTYSELSPHRRDLGAGIVAMPNMSRKSLDKYQNRVEAMIQKNPLDESFIRRKFLSNMSYQQKATDLQYDSADEVDVSILHQKMSARRNSQMNIFYRFFSFIVSAFSSSYATLKQKIWRRNSQNYVSYTPIKRQNQKGFLQTIYSYVQKIVLLCISKVYLFISTILCLDTWLLYTRSENVNENRKRKRFLLGLLILFPLMLFGAFLLSDDTTASNVFLIKAKNNYSPEQLKIRLDYITQYFYKLSSQSLPQINLNFGWLLSPLFSFGAIIREFLSSKNQQQQQQQQLKMNLDEEKFQILLKHIDDYVDSTIEQKLTINNDAMLTKVNDRLVLIISNQINDALKQSKYRLTAKDIEEIVNQIRVQLNQDFDEREKLILSKVSLNSNENIEKIKLIASDSINFGQLKDVKLENERIDIDKIILMILESNKISTFFDDRLKAFNNRLDAHNSDMSDLKMNIDKIKLEIVEKFSNYDEELYNIRMERASISDDLIRLKRENDDAIRNILLKIDEKFNTFSDYSSIDASVRKSLLSILGFNSAELSDEALLKHWIDNTFVAKGYLENHLQNLELRLNEAFKKQLDQNAGILMEEVNERLTSQIKLNVQQYSMNNAKNADIKATGFLSEADVIKIVKEVLSVYDADKTGLVDYALESAGGEVISTRCTENYRTRSAEISIFGIPIWYPNNTPRTVISPTINPGECWAFQGFPGFLVIKLNNLIHVTGFTVEHIPQANAPNNIIDSAPNNFSVWGLTSEFDKNPVLFGNYFYSAEKNAPSLQYFPVQNKAIEQPYRFVELVIESNHGNPKYTCLYRFRVHGEMK